VHPDDNARASTDENCEQAATCTSAILKALPILAPDLFVEFVCGKDGIKNKCEQNYPASGRNDREHPYTSPAHALSVLPPAPRLAESQSARLSGG
jgi:hypothetical protein